MPPMVHVAHAPAVHHAGGGGGVGCADTERLSTASSETSIPSITIRTRLALVVVAITIVFVISSLLVRSTMTTIVSLRREARLAER